jgi:hypothetical protein
MNNLYNKNWYRLNIDASTALRDSFNPVKYYEQSEFKGKPVAFWVHHGEELQTIFSDKWLLQMESLDLKIGSCMIFHRQPYYINPEIHIDVYKDQTPSIYALNWTLEKDDDSEMVWYDIPLDTGSPDNQSISTPYKRWPIDGNYPEIERCSIGNKVTLVNIGVPHNVIVNKKPRWCFSIRMYRYDKPISNWEEAVEYFKPFIVE